MPLLAHMQGVYIRYIKKVFQTLDSFSTVAAHLCVCLFAVSNFTCIKMCTLYVLFFQLTWVSFTDVYWGVLIDVGDVLETSLSYLENSAIGTALAPISPNTRGIIVYFCTVVGYIQNDSPAK